jgi:hypothetical protein
MCYKDIWNNVQKCASAQGKITFKKDGSLTSDITSDDKKCSGSSKGSWRLDCDKLIFTIGKAEFAGTQTESGFSGDVIVGGQKTGTWSAENCGGG